MLLRWSNILILLGYITAFISLVSPFFILFGDVPIVLSKNGEIWKTDFHHFAPADALICFFIIILPTFAWLFAVIQILCLANYYKKGCIFSYPNTRCFLRIGIALVVLGILSNIVSTLLNYYLYYRNISPWLGDIYWLELCDPGFVMAGIFFIVLGKIMNYGTQLQDNERFTI